MKNMILTSLCAIFLFTSFMIPEKATQHGNGIRMVFINNTKHDKLYLAIHAMHMDKYWETKYWYTLYQNTETYVYLTPNTIFQFYAESDYDYTDRKAVWQGNDGEGQYIDGSFYDTQQVVIDESQVVYEPETGTFKYIMQLQD